MDWFVSEHCPVLVMWSKLVLLGLLAFTVGLASATELEAENCHPQCRWACDDPACPALCHPVCERPQCEIQCEPLSMADCDVSCKKPVCNVRCPKDLCEKADCPQCETVCQTADCKAICQPPEPKCEPICKDTKCDWQCEKPSVCAKPKCQLTCEPVKCAAKKPKEGCCKCDPENVKKAVAQADAKSGGEGDTSLAERMSMMEVMHTIKHRLNQGEEEMCCPCT